MHMVERMAPLVTDALSTLAGPALPAAEPGVQFVFDRSQLSMPTQIELIEPTAASLARRAAETGACSQEQASNLLLVFTEALTNAVIHGNLEVSSGLRQSGDGTFARAIAERSNDPCYCERTVEICADYDGDLAAWTITDQGRGFDYLGHLRRLDCEPADVEAPSGRGILLMRAFTDELRWSLDGRQVRLALRRQANDRRRQPRTPMRLPVRVAPLTAGGAIDWARAFGAVAVDAGPGGIGLLQSRLESARRLLIEIPGDGEPVFLPATVCHVRQLDDALVQIGCRFTDDPPAFSPSRQAAMEQLERVIEQARADAQCRRRQDERREQIRTGYTRLIEVQDGTGEAATAKLARNLALSGMAFLSRQPMAVGQSIEIRLVEEQPATGPMKAAVVRCLRIAEEMHDIGVQFV